MRTLKAFAVALPMLLAASPLVMLAAVPAQAQEQKAAANQVSAAVGKPLQEAQALMTAKKFREARAKLKEADALPNKTPYEQSLVDEYTASVAVNLGDYATAARSFEATLTRGFLPAAQVPQRLMTLTQLNYHAKEYGKAIEYGNRYLKEVGANQEVAELVMQAHFQRNDYANTITALQGLIRASQQAGKAPKHAWLQMLMSSQHQLGREQDLIATLEQTLRLYPSAEYWQTMFVYVQRGGGTDRQLLENYRLKHAVGAAQNADYVGMAELALALSVPGDAKQVLEAGFQKGILGTAAATKDRENRLLNMARTQSAEDQKTLASQDAEMKAAAAGDGDVKLGEAYLSYAQYDKAAAVIQRGLAKGGVKDVDLAKLHLGVALLHLKQSAEAAKVFAGVSSKSRYAQLARLWGIHAAAAK